MGGNAALHKREGGHVWRIVCRCDANASGDDAATAFGGNLSHSDGVELPRKLDVSGWGVRALVQPVVEFRTCGEYGNETLERFENGDRWNEYVTADGVSDPEGGDEWAGSVLPRLAGASEL